MKPVRTFVKQYWQCSAAVVSAALGLGLHLSGHPAASHLVLGSTALLLTLPLLRDMWRDLREGTYGVDILAVTAIVTAVVMREYWAAIVIVLMLTGGEALEDYAEHRARREMSSLLQNAPRTAHVLRGRNTHDMPVAMVNTGDKLVIRPGEVVPVDAVVLEGRAAVDEASITGESVPEERAPGGSLLSGSVVMDAQLVVRAVRPAAESQYEQIVKLVRSAAASKAPFVRMADRFAIPFTIVSFAIAIGAWAVSGESLRFLQVMVVATPCPLILAAPIAIISGMSRASKAGIIVKNGTALERLAAAKSVAFDKTGTLTHGSLRVTRIQTFNGFSQADVAGYAAALERNSNHILAASILAHAASLAAKVPTVKYIRETAGQGLTATIRGKQVLVGRSLLLDDSGIAVPQSVSRAAARQTSTFVAVGDTLAGVLYFEDGVRSDSKQTIQRLKDSGVEDVYLITGDNEAAAQRVASQVGVRAQHVVAHALPIDKLKTVERVAKPPVAFVGDGVNDAPVLVAADVGIALGAKGSTAASESADIVIMQDNLSKVADVRAIAQRTFAIARQSILVGIGLSVLLMIVFATGKFKPVYGAAVQELVDVVVIFNALRAHVAGRHTGI